MTVSDLWLIILAVSTPIAGFVGFAVQVRNIKKIRLENNKLMLEVEKLNREKEKEESRIVMPTTEEVRRYVYQEPNIRANPPSFSMLSGYFVIILIFLGYLLYDFYRLAIWLMGGL